MSTPNIGWLYYKDYHRKNGDHIRFFQDAPEQKGDRRNEYFRQHYKEKNAAILGEPFDVAISTQLQVVSMIEKLKFKTIYPGLTLGTGYTHETGELGEFKLGFFFDYSTGYPCVPGSTVKGCLRSVFPQKKREEVADKKEKYDYLASAIRELPEFSKETILENDLSDAFDEKNSLKRMQFIDFLEREIFDGEKCEKNEDGTYKVEKKGDKTKFIYKPLCVYERDIFFDGYIVSSDHPAIERSTSQNPKPFIADDYITPHLNRKTPELSPFTNPVPLMFLKILPEVTIQFQFDLKDGLLTKKEKEKLFGRLLLDFGIGAKTNVGYGQFDLSKEERLKEKKEMAERKQKALLTELKRKETEKEASKTEAEKRIVNGALLQCKVVGKTNKEVFFMFDWDKELKFKKKIARLSEELQIDNIIEIEIIADFYITRRVLFSNTVTIIQ